MSELKYVIFFTVLLIGVPINYILAKKYKMYENFLWFLMVFFTTVEVTINFFSMENYRGTSRGMEIGMVDIAVLSMLAVILSRKDEHSLQIPPGSILYFIYFIFSAISIMNSDIVLYSNFEIWKMVRMYLFFFVAYNMIRSFEDIKKIVIIISIVISYVTIIVLKQKYLEGIFQASGTFPHQNSMVMYMIVYGTFILGYLLNDSKSKIYIWLPVFAMAGFDILASLSRAGLALFVFSISIVFFFSYINKTNVRKIGITIIFLIGASIVLFKAMDTIVERFTTASEDSADTRLRLAVVAQNMANDKTFGIGLNNYGLKTNPPYWYGDHLEINAFVTNPKTGEVQQGIVETIYLLIAAETGWHNLIVYFTFIFSMYFRNFRNFLALKGHEYRWVTIGLLGGLLAIYIQSSLEWVLKQTHNFYQLMFVFAIIGAVSRLIEMEQNKGKI